MKLKDFILELRTGFGDGMLVTSGDDGECGTQNLAEGRYFVLNGLWDVRDDEALENYLKSRKFPKVFVEDWLYRDIIEIDPFFDKDEARRWAEARFPDEIVSCKINVCLQYKSSDKNIWTKETLQKPFTVFGEFPFTDTWDYRGITREQVEALEDLEYGGLYNLVIDYILRAGTDYIEEMDDQYFQELEEEEKRLDEEHYQKYLESKRRYDAGETNHRLSEHRIDSGLNLEVQKIAKQVMDICENEATTFYAYLRYFAW